MECLIDPKQKFCYIPIYKNAVTKIEPVLLDHGWWKVQEYFKIDKNLRDKILHIVVLRDPFERLKSQIFSLCENSFTRAELDHLTATGHLRDFCDLFLYCIKQNFHKHLVLQSTFLESIDIKNIQYFWLNPQFGYQFNKWLQSENEHIPFNNYVVNRRDPNNIMVKYIEEFLFDYKNDKFKKDLIEFLQPDYNLINSVDFFVKK